MADIFDYLTWRGDLDFNTSPFNPVDNIIFSQLSYLTFDGIVPGPDEKEGISLYLAVKLFEERLSSPEGIELTSIFKDDPKFVSALASSKRYRDCYLLGFVNHTDTSSEIQFSALCVYINDKNNFIAYRGTDSSIVGWKENFNLSFREFIPSQLEAIQYLEKMAPKLRGPLRVGGHSKGGNLAIYAASGCRRCIQNRITDIYSNDSPGFHEKVIASEGFKAVKDRIRSYVPQASVIGMVLEHGYENTVIRSAQKGLMQHDLYSWEVSHNDLVHADKSTISSRFVNKTLREWIDSLDNTGREQFIEAMYHIFSSADVKSIYDLGASWFGTACRIIKSLSHIDTETRKMIRKILAELFRTAGRNIDTFINNEA